MRTPSSFCGPGVSTLSLLLLAAACGGDDAVDDAPDARVVVVADGGRLALPGCGYDLVTRAGAEAPAVGVDALGADPDPRQIHLGYGDAPPATSMAIVWRTDEDTTATTVRWGVSGGALDQETDGLTYRYYSGLAGTGDLIRLHEVHLCGLQPDTAYDYQVGGVGVDGTEVFSTVATFRTAPDLAASPDAEVTIGYVGDGRGGYDVWTEIATRLQTYAPDLLVYTGDVVTIGQSQDEWDEFFAGAPELLREVPVVLAHGNHEVNAIHYYAQFAMPADEENFAFDFGPLHQVILNDSPVDSATMAGSTRDFLDADLAAAVTADAPWKVVTHHRSLYSSSTNHGSDTTLRALWAPVYDEHGVDLVVSGHDHIFERTHPIRGEVIGTEPADGTIYIVSGGAGADLYGIEPQEFSAFSESTHSFTVMEMRRGMLSSASYRADGSPLDSFTITKPAP